jgi:electron transfer flavoprotein beta subunit
LPVLITMLEGVNEIRRGTLDDAYRAARAKIVTWNAADAGITDLTKCGLRGSPTIVKKVFAPSPRAEKARQVATIDLTMEALAETVMDEIFKRQPSLEGDLMRFSAGQ